LTHEFGDDGFHEIHLSGKQLVFLFMATTVVSIVIFLCGVQVGRGVPTERSQDALADPLAAASASPAATPPAAALAPPADEPPAPPSEADDLSYKKRLEGETPARESLRSAAEAPAPAPAPPVVRTRETPARESPAREAAAPSPASQKTVAGTAQPGTWVLQVHALRDAKVANSIVQRLSKKGYPAFLVASGGPTSMFRVFVGRYKDRDEADRVAQRLKRDEQFNPWSTR
jgi:cell division septation protein DedD